MTEPTNTAVAAAWFVDPTDASQWRWWDGSQWTDHVAPVVPVAEQPGAATATAAESTLHAVATPEPERWAIPPADAPLFPQNGYPKDVHPAFVAARRSLHVVRAPITGLRIAAGGVVMAIGVALERMLGSDLIGAGITMIRHALWDVHDDARDTPWTELFRRRGLDPGRGIHARWFEQQNLIPEFGKASTVQPRWTAGGLLGGMPAICGECYAVFDGDDCRESRRYRMFAAFELPPLAAARHRKVSVQRRGLTRLALGSPHGMRDVQFESIAVNQALAVYVDATSDDVSVRELFGPQLLAALGEHPVAWEQRRDLLVVHCDVPSEPGRELDAFMRSAVAVARAYWTDQD